MQAPGNAYRRGGTKTQSVPAELHGRTRTPAAVNRSSASESGLADNQAYSRSVLPGSSLSGKQTAPGRGSINTPLTGFWAPSNEIYNDPEVFKSWRDDYSTADKSGDLGDRYTYLQPPVRPLDHQASRCSGVTRCDQLPKEQYPQCVVPRSSVPFSSGSGNRSYGTSPSPAMQDWMRSSEDRFSYTLSYGGPRRN